MGELNRRNFLKTGGAFALTGMMANHLALRRLTGTRMRVIVQTAEKS